MRAFLITCITLMFAAGIYGATDMARDLSNDKLIDYENPNARHSQNLLAIVKTLGIGFEKYAGNPGEITAMKSQRNRSLSEKKAEVTEYFSEFSRGDE